MEPRKFFMRRAIGLIILFAIIGLVAAFYSFNNYIYEKKQGDGTVEPYQATLSGEYVCLPHKDTSGPQTDECAFGLKTDVGEYYAMNTYAMSQMHEPLNPGDRITASGVVTPIELLSTNQWEKYPIEGIFSVTNSLQVNQ